MPSLGADMMAGRLVEWRVKPGDVVHRGDIVAVVDTSKAEIDVEIFEDGVISELLVPAGQQVPVGTVLALVRAAGAEADAAPEPVIAAAEPALRTAQRPAPVFTSAPPGRAATPPGAARPRVTPLARRLAAELGVPLEQAQGSGTSGAILSGDVRRLAENAAAEEPEQPLPDAGDGMRAAIAAAMARSNRDIPHYYLATSIDMSDALRWLAAYNAERPVRERLLPAVLMLKTVALAAREAPQMNGFWIDGRLEAAPAVHLGVAVSLRRGGLIAPAIHDADTKPLDELMRDLRDLVARARSGGVRSSELTDPTITVTSLGDRGARSVLGVIYPPQVALVGLGAVSQRPWAVDGRVEARPVLDASLAADHRASDGLAGSVFLSAIGQLLEHPEQL